MKKIGKKSQEWIKARAKLKKEYLEKGITSCELKFPYCTNAMFLAFAHRYKRDDPRCEHTFKQTLLACTNCHRQIEYDKQLTKDVFNKLR